MAKGNYDIYVVFVERGLELLRDSGRLGFILPHKFFNSQYGAPIRSIVASGKHLAQVVHFGHAQVFAGATTYTCLLFLNQSETPQVHFAQVDDLSLWRTSRVTTNGDIPAESVTEREWNFVVGESAPLVARFRDFPLALDDIADVFVGLQTSADDVYIMDFVTESKATVTLRSKALGCECELEMPLIHFIVSGTDVNGYAPLPKRQCIVFPYDVTDERVRLLDMKEISDTYPRTAEYLSQNRKRLESREHGKFRGKDWHRFGRSQNLGIQERVKLCVPRLVESLHVGFDVDGSRFLDNVDVCGITLKDPFAYFHKKFLLGLLNSKVLRWYFPFVSAPFRGGWRSANRQFLSQVPVPGVDLDNNCHANLHARVISVVEQMLTLHKQRASAKTTHERAALSRQIDATDREIDQLVYELYGLTDEEIRIVEEATAR